MAQQKTDGVHFKRGEGRRLEYFWRIGSQKSKIFTSHSECAQDFISKYVQKYPKYEQLVNNKTWEQKYAIFGIKMEKE